MGIVERINKINRASSYRIYLFDNIKFVAILLVVIGHAIDFLTVQDNNFFEKSLFLGIYSVHMPLFIFISGLFLKPMDKYTQFPKQKVISYILIGISMRIVNTVSALLLNAEEQNFSVFSMYDSLSWFVGAMAILISIMWIFREYNTRILFLISLAIGCMAGYDKNLGDKFALMRVFVFLPFFIIGYMIKPENLANLLSNKWVKLVSAIIIAGIILLFLLNHDIYIVRPIFTGRNRFTVLKELYDFGLLIRLGCYMFSAIFGLAIMYIIPKKKLLFVSSAGTKTLQIYFWHNVFIIVMERFKVYEFIASYTGETIATGLYIIIAVGITFVCTLPVFSFPTKQLLAFGK